MAKDSDSGEKPLHHNQYFAALTVSLGAIGVGTILGFNSPASYQLRVARAGPITSSTNQSAEIFGAPTRATNQSVDIFGAPTRATNQSVDIFGAPTRATNQSVDIFGAPARATNQSVDIFGAPARDLWNTTVTNPQVEFFFGAADVRTRSPDDIVMTTEELSWFMSVFALGALVGGLLSSPLMNTVGRKGTLLVSAVPAVAGWLMTGFGKTLPVLLLGRVLTGVFLGINTSAGNAYVGEIASSDIRGILGSFFELFLVVGILLVMAVGAYIKWQVLAIFCTAPCALFGLLMIFNRESPAFLLLKGKEEKARAALQYFRGPDYCIEKEIADVKDSQKEAQEAKFRPADLKKPHIYKPLIITFTIGMYSQLCGIEVLTSNLSTIFRSAGTNLSEDASSIICILVEIVAGMGAIFLMERAGRKTLLIVSSVLMALSHGSMGAYFYLLDTDRVWTETHISFLPLTALITFVSAYGLGLGAIVWVLLGEMLPPLVRETAAAITVSLVWTCSFLTVLSYEHLHETFHDYGFFWVYAGICALGTVFCATVVKETKGKTLEEISKMFVNEAIDDETRM